MIQIRNQDLPGGIIGYSVIVLFDIFEIESLFLEDFSIKCVSFTQEDVICSILIVSLSLF